MRFSQFVAFHLVVCDSPRLSPWSAFVGRKIFFVCLRTLLQMYFLLALSISRKFQIPMATFLHLFSCCFASDPHLCLWFWAWETFQAAALTMHSILRSVRFECDSQAFLRLTRLSNGIATYKNMGWPKKTTLIPILVTNPQCSTIWQPVSLITIPDPCTEVSIDACVPGNVGIRWVGMNRKWALYSCSSMNLCRWEQHSSTVNPILPSWTRWQVVLNVGKSPAHQGIYLRGNSHSRKFQIKVLHKESRQPKAGAKAKISDAYKQYYDSLNYDVYLTDYLQSGWSQRIQLFVKGWQ